MADKQRTEVPTSVFTDKAAFVNAALDDKRHRWSVTAGGVEYFGLASTPDKFWKSVAAAVVPNVQPIDRDAFVAMVKAELNGGKGDA